MLVSDLKPGMTAVFGDAECSCTTIEYPITAVASVDPIHTRVDFDTPGGPSWMIVPSDRQAPRIKES